jgi:3-isopropylmalate dehydrogenase
MNLSVTHAVRPRLTESMGSECREFDSTKPHVVGVLTGEGVGPEVVPAALALLNILRGHTSRRFELREGGLIGCSAKAVHGSSLSSEVTAFATDVFRDSGALFCGPGGDRFVYELRRAFDLYCKFTPLQPLPELQEAGVVRPHAVAGANIVAIRENSGGIYQGSWSTEVDKDGNDVAHHHFHYTEGMVRRILKVGLRLAERRRKRLQMVLKPAGIPSISDLWRRCAEQMAPEHGVSVMEYEIDNATYQLIADPAQFDVIISPNLFGDVLADCGSLLLASRGLSYSGNFNAAGNGVYQTGHGAARDIAGRDLANPIGQILSLGMMLRESFDWPQADAALRRAVRTTLRGGVCTSDVAMAGSTVLGTRAFGAAVAETLEAQLSGEILL